MDDFGPWKESECSDATPSPGSEPSREVEIAGLTWDAAMTPALGARGPFLQYLVELLCVLAVAPNVAEAQHLADRMTRPAGCERPFVRRCISRRRWPFDVLTDRGFLDGRWPRVAAAFDAFKTVVERHATGAPRTCCAIGTICRATEDTLLAFVDAVRRLLRYFNNVANGQRISDDDSAMVSSNVPNIAHPECEGLGSAQAVDNISEVCRLLQHACPPRPDPVGLSEAWRCAVIDAAKLADTVREVVQHYEGEQEDMAMGYRAFN